MKKEEGQIVYAVWLAPSRKGATFPGMATAEMIKEIRRLPEGEAARLLDYLFSDERELDRLLAAFDRLPCQHCLTEDEILALPRAHPAGQ